MNWKNAKVTIDLFALVFWSATLAMWMSGQIPWWIVLLFALHDIELKITL